MNPNPVAARHTEKWRGFRCRGPHPLQILRGKRTACCPRAQGVEHLLDIGDVVGRRAMGNSRRGLVIGLIALALAGCGTPVSSGQLAENKYWVTGVSPYGWFGHPSPEGVAGKAASLCPAGYDKLSEQKGVFEGRYLRWEIQCRPVTASSQP